MDAPIVLLVMTFLLLLATPSFVARAGFGRRAIWLGASTGFVILFLVFDHWGPATSHFFGLDTEDFNLVGLVDVLFAYGAISLAVAGCVYKPRPKEPGKQGKPQWP